MRRGVISDVLLRCAVHRRGMCTDGTCARSWGPIPRRWLWRRFLAAVATSCASRGDTSAAGSTVEEPRTRLLAEGGIPRRVCFNFIKLNAFIVVVTLEHLELNAFCLALIHHLELDGFVVGHVYFVMSGGLPILSVDATLCEKRSESLTIKKHFKVPP